MALPIGFLDLYYWMAAPYLHQLLCIGRRARKNARYGLGALKYWAGLDKTIEKAEFIGGRLSACFGNEIHLMGQPPLPSLEDANPFVGVVFGIIIFELIRKRQSEYGSSKS